MDNRQDTLSAMPPSGAATLPQVAPPQLVMPGGRTLKPWLVLGSIVFGFFMSLLDTTITNIALDNIETNLKTDLSTVSWVINAYTLTFAALLVTTGRLADQFGRKRLYMVGMLIFSFGSLLCAFAPSIEALIAFRVFQAIGAAILEAVSLAIIVPVFPKEQRTAAIGLWGALAGLAAAVGPVLGGFLLEVGRGNLEWRWIFFVNLPFCLVGLIMIARNVPEIRDHHSSRRIDGLGVVLLAGSILALAFGFTKAADWGWGSGGVVGLFGLAAVGLVVFFIVETHKSEPLLDFALFKIPSFTAACLVIIIFTTSFQAVLVILIQYFAIAQNKSALEASLAIIWLPLAAFVSSAASGIFGDKINARYLVALGMTLMGVGLLSLSILPAPASYFDTLWREIILGLGAGLCFTSIPNTALAGVPRAKLGAGNGAYTTFKQLGYVLGVAIFISLLTGQLKANNLTATQGAINLQTTLRDSFAFVWLIGGILALIGIVPALFTTSSGAEMSLEEAELAA